MYNGIPREIAQSSLGRLKCVWVPSPFVEYTYYFAFSYSVIAAYLGIEVPLLAAGLITCLAAFCFVKTGANRRDTYAPIVFLLACQISYILIQVGVHDVSLMSDFLRWFILWIFATVIVQSLCLRHGFLLRCTIVIFVLGLIAVPHLGFNMDVVERARADIDIGGGLRNPNGLAAWFGFCSVSLGIAGMEARRGNNSRWLYWIASIVSLLVVALTVSRGTLLGCAIALTVGFRRLLKRAFVPLLFIILLAGVVFESGLINHIVSNYEDRATEETGRFLLWPHVIDRFLESPFVGVGVPDIETYIPEVGHSISTPHNSFLFFSLASGFVPLAFYVGFWIRAVRSSLLDVRRSEYSPFRVPLLLYAFVAFFLADVSAEPWSIVALAVAAGPPLFRRQEHPQVTGRLRSRRLAPGLEIFSKARIIQ